MTISTPVYCTREQVKAALDSKESARSNGQIDRAVEAAARSIEGLTHRRFYPWTGTRYFDWPVYPAGTAWRLWLNSNELASITTLVAGGATLTSAQYLLRRSDNRDEPPYTHVEINLATSAAFTVGNTYQRNIAITGVYIGCPPNETPAGALAAAVSSTTATAVNVTDSATVGVGSILRVDTERMLVVEKTMLTTGQTLQGSLTASVANETLPVTSGAAYTVGETLLLDSERMLVVDIAGNTLTVKRAWDGSTLAAHTGSTIYAPRTLTVTRAALGTTAATHSNSAAAYVHLVPGLVRDLAVAEAQAQLLREVAGYARIASNRDTTSGAGRSSDRDLDDLRARAVDTFGRKARLRGV